MPAIVLRAKLTGTYLPIVRFCRVNHATPITILHPAADVLKAFVVLHTLFTSFRLVTNFLLNHFLHEIIGF
jgi:hypothetical protein